jgi:hypothetical protein
MSSRVARRILWIAFTCLLVTRVAAAAGNRLSADFDGDGRYDLAALLQGGAVPSVQVWLSTTRAVTVVRIEAPVSAIAAADLDGDRRAELIAGGATMSLHVWTLRDRAFERIEPRRTRTGGLSRRTEHGVDDQGDQALAAVPASSPMRAALRHASRPRAPDVTAALVVPEDVHGQSPSLASPLGPRPPPAFC